MTDLITKLDKLQLLHQEIFNDALKIRDSIDVGDEFVNSSLRDYFLQHFTFLQSEHYIEIAKDLLTKKIV